MPANFSVRTRSTALITDQDGDNVADAGDVLRTTLTIHNTGTTALDVTIEDLLNGSTLNPGSIKIGPMAVDDVATISGNTPQVFTFAELLGNDIDPDGSNATMTITGVSGANHGTVTIDTIAQTVTFVPETGYQGAASFQYSVADAQGLTNVAGFEGTVSVTVSGLVWYVDANYAGANGAPDGSYLKPFTSLTNLNDDGTLGTGRVGPADGIAGDDDVDGTNDTIFVYDRGNAAVNGGITLEAGQKLFGDAHTFVVNGITIGATANQTTINSHSVNNTNYGVTLSTGNEIQGINLDGDNTGTTNLRDGGGTVGSFTMGNSSITGSGQAVDIDQGGALTVSLTTLSSSSSTAEGVHLAGTAANLLTGTFTASAGAIQTSTGTGFLVGVAGGGTASSGGSIDITYNGDISSPSGSLVEIQDRTGGTVDFNGSLTEGTINAGQTGILIDGSAGTINFDGQTFVSAGAGTGNGVTLTNNSGTINFNATGTGLDITTTSGTGLVFTGGGTLNVTGSANSVVTGTGQIMNLSGTMGTSGIAFQTLTSGNVAAGNAININNLDAAGAGTFSGGAVTIGGTAGAGADGINITNSDSTFTFSSATIDNTQGDGIEINGQTQTQGSVTFTTVNIDGTTGSGVEIVGNTNAVNVNGGTIGATNDAAAETVLINGGSGNVTINANLTNGTGGVDIVDISNRTGGTVAFGGTLSSTGGAGGIDIASSAGTINFTGSQITLTTGANAAVNITSNTAAINFTGGSLDITTTGGQGLSANATGGSVTVTGSGNTVSTGAGTAVNIQGTDIGAAGVTFNTVNTSGASSGIILANTGSAGFFTVVGTAGVNGSGGSILNSTGNGIDLNNVSNVNLTGVTVTGSGGSGIRGTSVNGMTMTNVTSSTNGNAVEEGGVYLTNASGSIFVTNSTFNANADDNFWIINDTGSLNLTVTGSTFSNSYQGAFGDDNLILQANNTANITALITSSTFTNAEGDHFQFATNLSASGSSHISLTNNVMSNNQSSAVVLGSGVTISPSGSADLRVLISGNTITDTISGFAINLNAIDTSSAALIEATIQNNTIGTSGVPDSGPEQSGAIQVRITGSGTMNALVDNNDIFDFGSGSAIDVSAAEGATNGSNSITNVTVTNNLVTGADPTNSLRAFTVQAGASAGTHNNSIRVLVDNNVWDNNYSGGLTIDARYIAFSNGDVLSPGYAGGATDPAAFAAFMAAQNSPGNGTASAALGGAGTFGNTPGGTNPTLPSAPNTPPPPMLLAPEPPLTPPADDGDGKHAGDIPPPTDDGETGTGSDTGSGGKDDHAGDLPGDNSHPVIVDDGTLSQAELDYLVDAAIQRWIAAGASPEQVAAMRAANFSVADMTGVQLGMSDGSTIYIDNDGGRAGWFLDTTPGADEEYAGTGTRLTATGGAAAQGVDLLTVLMHELGHQAGLGDHYNISARDDLMYGYAYEGERRLPADGQAAGAVPGSIPHPVFQLGPVVVGTVPGDNAFVVQYDSTVNSQPEDRLVAYFNNDADISWRDVPAGTVFSASTNSELLAVDSLTLGDRVFIDANLNGSYDAGEGVAGVSLTLFADTNNNGVYDDGIDEAISFLDDGDGIYEPGTDTPTAASTPGAIALTVTTDANGLYAFNYLGEGDYIVRVNASNFLSGGPLDNELVIATAADPNDNVDNDNNGQAFAGYVATRAIRLDLGEEPTPGVGNDTNNTLDIGFITNLAPDAVDDSVSVAEDSGANDLTTQLLSNDTDPENDTRTITSATQGTHGTTSVVAGVLTYTPNGNYNGTDTFTYTIDDGNGNTDTATVNVTVTAVNDPVTGTVPATASLNEDAVNVAIAGMSISDVDATLAPAGVYDVTLSATQGVLSLTTITGLTFSTGDGTADTTMTFHGTLADINTALATATYTPNADYNGSAQIDLQVTDTFGGIVATGTGAATNDSDSIAVTVNSVNDEPAGTDDSAAPTEGLTYTFSTSDFSAGFSDPNDTPANAFAGVKITTLPAGASGIIKLNGVAIAAGDVITKTQLDNNELTFEPAAGSGGTAGSFTFQVQDDGGVLNGGVDLDQSPNTFTLNIGVPNFAPVLDLDADDSNSVGTGFTAAYTEGGAAAAISDTDVSITDADVGDDIVSATITITNPEAGDLLTVVGALPATITVDPASTDTMVVLLAAPGTSAADFQAAIEQITFSNTGDNPTDGGTNTSRSITVTVNDGDSDSNVATATIAVTDDNADAPSGTNATITAIEDTFRLLNAADLGFNDVDGTFASVTISAVTGGSLYFDADGTAGAGAPVLVATLPQTYTAQDLIDGKVSFRAGPNANGAGLGTITFTVTDDDGNTDASANTLTVDVSAVNDQPNIPNSPTINATEQTAIKINTAITVSDVDLDARNGGNGDYSGALFAINRNVSNPDDLFSFDTTGALFTVNGSNLEAGGNVIATLAQSGGILNINFVNNGTVPTTALVNDVLRHLQYTNLSDNPPASVNLVYIIHDGAPGGGQGTVIASNNIDGGQVTVNIAGVNDAPVNSLGGTIGTGEDAIDAWLSGMSISDPDANPATDVISVTFNVANGTLDIRTDVVGGVAPGDVTGDDTGTITVTATLNAINATLAAANGLTYTPTPNFNGNDTLTVTTNDQGANGSGGAKVDIDVGTISVSPQPDAPVAQPDAVSTPENVVGIGSLFANNGSGPDTDADGDTITISEVNGSGANVGVEITLASGAKLTVNANGTYSYNPNGKFNYLTDNTSGAVNTSTVGDTFQYTVAGGNTVTVTVTVNGVAGPGDLLFGDGTDNTITGTPQGDQFRLQQGGNDTVFGLGAADGFYFGGAFDANDSVNGGGGNDILILQGDYSAGLTFGTGTTSNITSIEGISLVPGNLTNYGDTANNFYDYNLTMLDANVAAGAILKINGHFLRAGEDLTFNGAAETNGSFTIFSGLGVENLTGGGGGDLFIFGHDGRFGAGDVVNGGGGYDVFYLRGDYVIDFNAVGFAGSLANIESIGLISGTDLQFVTGGDGEFDYDLTWNDSMLGAGLTLVVNGSRLTANETMEFDGSQETNGHFRIFGGAANDVLQGGGGNDLIYGGLGFDTLYGGAGNDIFRYQSAAESTPSGRDGIQDFALGDLIDLLRIDANSNVVGDQAFNFIGGGAFTNQAGQLRAENTVGPIWTVSGDTNGDGVADFEVVVVVADAHPLTSGDFIL